MEIKRPDYGCRPYSALEPLGYEGQGCVDVVMWLSGNSVSAPGFGRCMGIQDVTCASVESMLLDSRLQAPSGALNAS